MERCRAGCRTMSSRRGDAYVYAYFNHARHVRSKESRSQSENTQPSLADAALIFDGFYQTHEDDRERYDEQRFVSVGQAVNGVVVVIHTIVTDDHIHVISARRAEPYEARHYWKEYARYSSR